MCTNSPAKSNSLSGGAEGVGKLSWQTFNCIFDSNDDDDDNQEGVGKLSWKTGQTFNCIFDLNQINRQSSTFNLLLKKNFLQYYRTDHQSQKTYIGFPYKHDHHEHRVNDIILILMLIMMMLILMMMLIINLMMMIIILTMMMMMIITLMMMTTIMIMTIRRGIGGLSKPPSRSHRPRLLDAWQTGRIITTLMFMKTMWRSDHHHIDDDEHDVEVR